MVGSVALLCLLAVAIQWFVAQVHDSRRRLLEARVHQDLRAAADLLAHELRRAGYWPHAGSAGHGLNPYRAMTIATGVAGAVTYSYSRDEIENDVVDLADAGGFRLAGEALQSLSGGSWQAVTDPGTVRITRFVLTPQVVAVGLGRYCTPPCDDATAACPVLRIRSLRIELGGQSTADPAIARELRETVRLRNDDLPGPRCPAPT